MFNRKWEVYANISQKEALQLFKQIIGKQGMDYKIEKAPPNIMYDPNNEQFIIKTKNFSINVIYVSNDPITRIFANLLGTAHNFKGISFLSIGYNKSNSAELPIILRKFTEMSPESPWNITAYPRFRFAVLLQLITKRKWKRFLYK
ncbi:hypothetical protein NSA56_00830 [Oceanobacillus caeni]|uniref:hypothetical protein n=1 Tax=Oceanobacillus caeni TaxID=405946 RepID=UPI002149EA92|nr:hypothetical protein [Oceanobacillus caeni]MCR1832939.1 hypothetical protein [Oceanobacillus caeni]